ncbi:unnamed protein product, partial [Tenebrio molitor]
LGWCRSSCSALVFRVWTKSAQSKRFCKHAMTSAMHILRKWEQEKSRKLYTRDVSSSFVCFT